MGVGLSTSTTKVGRIWGLRRTRQIPDPSRHCPLERSSRFRKSAVSIIGTNGRLRKHQASRRACARPRCGERTRRTQARFLQSIKRSGGLASHATRSDRIQPELQSLERDCLTGAGRHCFGERQDGTRCPGDAMAGPARLRSLDEVRRTSARSRGLPAVARGSSEALSSSEHRS